MFPVLVTVYQMLDCHDMNVVNIRSAALGSEEFGSGNEWTTLLKDVDELDWCILSLDVQNTYGLPFEVTLTSESKGKAPVYAGATCLTCLSQSQSRELYHPGQLIGEGIVSIELYAIAHFSLKIYSACGTLLPCIIVNVRTDTVADRPPVRCDEPYFL